MELRRGTFLLPSCLRGHKGTSSGSAERKLESGTPAITGVLRETASSLLLVPEPKRSLLSNILPRTCTSQSIMVGLRMKRVA